MRKADCDCIDAYERSRMTSKGLEEYDRSERFLDPTTVELFQYVEWNVDGCFLDHVEHRSIRLDLNFCPQCGKAYKEIEP